MKKHIPNNLNNYTPNTPSKTIISILRVVTRFTGRLLFQIEYLGTKHLENLEAGGLIIASNHQTYLDPFLICVPIYKDLRFMAWDKAFEWKIVGKCIGKLGAFPMSLGRGGTPSSLRHSIKLLNDGMAVIIFPEASRENSDGKMLPFKTGAVRLATETNSQLLPVTIKGGNRVWSKEDRYPRLGKITITYHSPYRIPAPAENKDSQTFIREQTAKLRKIIAEENYS
ncbi:MAG: lysophospholipid acyltransferase family protein [Pyrinomonadaceae bacterium]